MANLNVNEIKRLTFLSFALIMNINVKKLNRSIVWQKMKLSPFTNHFENAKELCDLIFSKT